MCGNFFEYIYDDCNEKILSKSEASYRFYLFDVCLKFTNKYLRDKKINMTFLPGEIELVSMTTQLKQKGLNNSHYKYNADGIIKDNQSDLEILLTEVSSAFGSNEVGKISFDHYKAMFGQLSMLRTVAHLYEYASFNTFKQLKVHFVHGHGTAIRHWTMSVQSPEIFVMNKEQKVEVPVKFAQKDLYLLEFIEFYNSLALALRDTTEILTQLKQEHKEAKASNTNCKSLLGSVDPVIIRLNEGKHLGTVADEGPMSVPPSPDRDQK